MIHIRNHQIGGEIAKTLNMAVQRTIGLTKNGGSQ